MDTRLTAAVVTGALALGGLGAGLVALPVIASAATVEATDEGTVPEQGPVGRGGDGWHGERSGVGRHRGDGGPGGPRLEEAAGLLGLTEAELFVQLKEGLSLAAVAEAEGVPVDDLVDGLVTAARAHAAEHVAAGDITQEEADRRLVDVEMRISTLVQTEDLPLRHGHGRGGHHDAVGDDSDHSDHSDDTDATTSDAPSTPGAEATTGTAGLTA